MVQDGDEVGWWQFEDASEIIIIDRIDAVLPALRRIEERVNLCTRHTPLRDAGSTQDYQVPAMKKGMHGGKATGRPVSRGCH